MGLLSQGQKDADLYGYGPAPDPSPAELDRALIKHLTRGGLLGTMERAGKGLLGDAVDWLAGGAIAGADPTIALMRGDDIDQPLLPTPESGGKSRLGAVASAINPHLIPGAPEGALGSFGGVKAKTADHAKLAEAKDMLKKGAGEAEIRGRTGWFKGLDGHWRFEIPDNNLKLTADGFEHPELFEAYPELKDNTPIEYFDAKDEPDYLAYFKPSTGAVGIVNDAPPDTARRWLGHELQHKVQDHEGHSPGTYAQSPEVEEMALRDLETAYGEAERIRAEYDASLKDFLDQSGGTGWFGPRQTHIEQFHERYPDLAAANSQATAFLKAMKTDAGVDRLIDQFSFDAYQRTLGETEARAVEDRMDYTPEQRRMTPPLDTQDIPRSPLLPDAELEVLQQRWPAESAAEQPRKGILDWFR